MRRLLVWGFALLGIASLIRPMLPASLFDGDEPGADVLQSPGFEDLEAGAAATPETCYHVASVTKAFTATLAVLLQLASHASGLPPGVMRSVQSVEGRYALEPEKLYDHLADVELLFDPGAGQAYSNLGFGLLGHALSRAAGTPYDQLIEELLCDPLGLAHTGIQPAAGDRVATGYGRQLQERQRVDRLRAGAPRGRRGAHELRRSAR
jgi:CubicO group peptidase (beta-lactamase class C family)